MAFCEKPAFATRLLKYIVFSILWLNTMRASAQDSLNNAITIDTNTHSVQHNPSLSKLLRKPRFWMVAGTHAGLWAGSYIALNKAWYADYPKESFHLFNDRKEWNQMDKAGHVWTAYHISRVSSRMWKWAGLSEKQSVIWGGVSAVLYQSIIEIQDGFSSEWGFSVSDMEANTIGAGLFMFQQLKWKEQRIQIKLSYWPYDYPGGLATRRDQLFGKGIAERILKDYNSQTYWISGNIHSFFKQSKWPAWLNLAIGYGSEGMLGGMENKWTDKNGTSFDRTDIARIRKFYLSPDIDLTKIKTKSKFLRSVFYVASMVKIPAPAIELNSKGKFKAYLVHF